LQWYSCVEPECQNKVRCCHDSAVVRTSAGFLCPSCWRLQNKPGTPCKTERARNEVRSVAILAQALSRFL
jgi:hypothetical protein